MRATYMIAADHASVDREGKGSAIGIFDKLLFDPDFPVASFFVLARVEGAVAGNMPTRWTIEGPGLDLQTHVIESTEIIPARQTTAIYSILRVLTSLAGPGAFQVNLFKNDDVVGELVVPIGEARP